MNLITCDAGRVTRRLGTGGACGRSRIPFAHCHRSVGGFRRPARSSGRHPRGGCGPTGHSGRPPVPPSPPGRSARRRRPGRLRNRRLRAGRLRRRSGAWLLAG
ncbi:hypothetical protein EST54_10090 [Streptomyces sioyaensis]|uniref:Uncharacterized protein n=1 Tax=Streptomyces sioyaensis TaxID=67364 RepID=A0A4Q1QZR1_9ACTN|nr:hypothetical protein EST54_10090 [Streptomyces sioyaensis]